MKRALDEAGFVANDEGSLLIVCGDCFDRGSENREVFDYLRSVRNKILIRGNHEDMLEVLFEKKHMGRIGFSNGTDQTLRDFFGDRVIGSIDVNYSFSNKLHFEEKGETVLALKDFIGGMYDYFETEHYVFTHGWLPVTFDANYDCSVDPDFRYAQPSDWERARFAEWYRMYGAGAVLEGKTVVCGHRASRFCSLLGVSRDPEDYSVFRAKGLAAIDGSTFHSGQVNVLVIDGEDLSFRTHRMSLRTEPFLKIACGEKRVELRLLDEKRGAIRVGDRIVFSHTENPSEVIRVRVIGLHAYRSFDEIARDFSSRELGFADGAESLGDRMRSYYSDEDVQKYGALAIRIAPENE